jgi:hypothetical protein
MIYQHKTTSLINRVDCEIMLRVVLVITKGEKKKTSKLILPTIKPENKVTAGLLIGK